MKKILVTIGIIILVVVLCFILCGLSTKPNMTIEEPSVSLTDEVIVEDTQKSIPTGFNLQDGTVWVLPHYDITGNIFAVDILPKDFDPKNEPHKLLEVSDVSTTEYIIDEPEIESVSDTVIKTSMTEFESEEVYLGDDWVLTHYCHCADCNGSYSGQPTASGRMPEVGVTVAVDSKIIKLGSRLRIEIPDGNGGYVCYRGYARADDTGGAIKGHRIDVFVGSHQEALNLGVIRNAKVWVEVIR